MVTKLGSQVTHGIHRGMSYRHTDIQTYRHTVIQTYRHTDIQTYRHTDIQTYRHTDIQTYRHTDIQSHFGSSIWICHFFQANPKRYSQLASF